MNDPLRGTYDFALANLEVDRGSRGRVFRAISQASRVLDVGCDTGRLGEILRREKSCVVHGIERDPMAAAQASSRLDHVEVRPVESEASLAGFTDFDVVLFLDVLEHLYDPWSVLRGAHATLRPGGKIIAVVPNVAHVSVVRRLLRGTFEYEDYGTMDRTHLRWFTRRSFAAAFAAAGFVEIRMEVVPVIPWLQELPWIGQPLAERLGHWLPDQLGGSLLGMGVRS
jgi:2-polyprenyl-3-methyl-5-hydroxy-6-metoxy-1,4-benzoquinol methylase